ncbi:hypothetical protein [Nocardioides halotolerans]|jgi:hypothetical protein|uniref:hypothetical protein n=1 Tax=Nocardioides halotolerans TaxID=433660 RepID=UPI0004251E69|nr:hypothetical protein [Nocardioides halotolerans]
MDSLLALVFYAAFYGGPTLVTIGLVLLFVIKVWPKVSWSPKAAIWMTGVGFGLCVVAVMFIWWLVSTIGS